MGKKKRNRWNNMRRWWRTSRWDWGYARLYRDRRARPPQKYGPFLLDRVRGRRCVFHGGQMKAWVEKKRRNTKTWNWICSGGPSGQTSAWGGQIGHKQCLAARPGILAVRPPATRLPDRTAFSALIQVCTIKNFFPLHFLPSYSIDF
jgi:hypothetical protein